MTLAKKTDNNKYTLQDYLAWPDNERWELVDGTAYDMTPAPGTKHQSVVGAIYSLFRIALSGGPCMAFIAPTDVVLSEYDVVQPDVLVVCDKGKITSANIQGAPDLVVEVLSPSTALKDKREKKALYEKHGIREYIIIDPTELYVERFVLKSGSYGAPDIMGPEEVLILRSIEGLEVRLSEVFETEALKQQKP